MLSSLKWRKYKRKKLVFLAESVFRTFTSLIEETLTDTYFSSGSKWTGEYWQRKRLHIGQFSRTGSTQLDRASCPTENFGRSFCDRILGAADSIGIDEYSTYDIYIYIYIYIQGAYDKFPDFFRMSIKNCCRLLKNSVSYCYTFYEMTDQFLWFQVQMNSYIGVGIHPTKAWFSQLVNFNKILF